MFPGRYLHKPVFINAFLKVTHSLKEVWFRFFISLQSHLTKPKHTLNIEKKFVDVRVLDLEKTFIFTRSCEVTEITRVFSVTAWRLEFSGRWGLRVQWSGSRWGEMVEFPGTVADRLCLLLWHVLSQEAGLQAPWVFMWAGGARSPSWSPQGCQHQKRVT